MGQKQCKFDNMKNQPINLSIVYEDWKICGLKKNLDNQRVSSQSFSGMQKMTALIFQFDISSWKAALKMQLMRENAT